ncbi:MAG: esterase [Dorea sp.]|nr:esterase [Dorea sp.]
MYKEVMNIYSPALGMAMPMTVFGHGGQPVLFIPCQDGKHVDFENFEMTKYWGPWIERGEIQIFSIDTIDLETWSDKNGNPRWRIQRYEDWIRYITDEVVPMIRDRFAAQNGYDAYFPGVIPFGCSLGATHALNLFLRRPDLFNGCLALSGIYTSEYGFGSYMDELVYQNSPVHYMANFPTDHPYIQMYNERKGIVCVGRGAWEEPSTTYRLKEIFEQKGIHIWVDPWGTDVEHHWYWWYKQVEYYVPYLLGQK